MDTEEYRVTYRPDKRHLKAITDPCLFETPHRSPQLPLWELGDGEWRAALQAELDAAGVHP